jgi:putative endonuclease
MNSWRVYILRCADDTLYTGITNRLPARLKAHNAAKGAKYTRTRWPVVLVWSTLCRSRGAALSLEYAIKRLLRREKQALIVAAGTVRARLIRRLKGADGKKRAARS